MTINLWACAAAFGVGVLVKGGKLTEALAAFLLFACVCFTGLTIYNEWFPAEIVSDVGN